MNFIFKRSAVKSRATNFLESEVSPVVLRLRPQKIQTPPAPQQKRIDERFRVNLSVRWNGYFEQQRGNVADISAGGCYILTAGEVSVMELIEVNIQLAAHVWARLWGQVVYHNEDIGFALRFVNNGSHEGLTLLSRLIEDVCEGPAQPL